MFSFSSSPIETSANAKNGGLPVFTFHKDGGSQISPQLPEISKVSGTILTKGREVGSSTRGEERTKAEKQARQDNTKDNAGQESLSKALYLRQRANKSLSFLQSFFGQVIVRVYTFRYMGFTCVILKIPMKP